jgi:beta-galactosidase
VSRAWQAGIVREVAGEGGFVTTCLSYTRPALEDRRLTATLDVTAGNPYYAMQDGLALPGADAARQGWTTHGTWTVFHSADRMYSSRQEPFLVTETNAAAIGGSATNFPAYDGQWRQVGWAMVARGARMVEYWHWHTLHYGTETYWGGILPHDQRPGRVYAELGQLGNELADAGPLLEGLVPDAGVGLVWSHPSLWGLAGQPAWETDGRPDARSYEEIVEAFYRGAFDAGVPVRIVHDNQLVDDAGTDLREPGDVAAELPVLLVPALYVASDELLTWLRRYAEAGGHLVLGPRSAYADTEARARREVKPALLADVAGVSYQEFSNLDAPVPVTPVTGDLEAGGRATRWVDALRPEGADVVATYDHPHHGRFAAVTTSAAGDGRVTVVGTVPDRRLARALIDLLVPDGDAWRGLRDGSVTVTSATTGDGRRVRVVHNWSWDPTDCTLPVSVTDVLAHEDLEAGSDLALAPWDVRVLVER